MIAIFLYLALVIGLLAWGRHLAIHAADQEEEGTQ
jgi:hypothetical protein